MAANPGDIAKEIQESACDTVLTDFSPASSHAPVLRALHEENTELKMILIGMEDDPEIFMNAVRLGARGYVLKDASALEIVMVIRRVGRGEAFCPASLCMVLIQHIWDEERKTIRLPGSLGANSGRLTHRQVELMNLVADGLSNKEIATSLNLSPYTVKNHLRRVMRQVEAGNRYDAVEMVRASGLLAEKRNTPANG
jgi:DNA-binding NarL/FixJ family response regulator